MMRTGVLARSWCIKICSSTKCIARCHVLLPGTYLHCEQLSKSQHPNRSRAHLGLLAPLHCRQIVQRSLGRFERACDADLVASAQCEVISSCEDLNSMREHAPLAAHTLLECCRCCSPTVHLKQRQDEVRAELARSDSDASSSMVQDKAIPSRCRSSQEVTHATV